MSTEVVFDIETIGDIRDMSTQKLTVISIFDYSTGKYSSYEESELSKLWPILEKSERLIGFNSDHFDIPILNKYYGGDLTKFPSLDLLKVVKESTGTRFKLNDLAKATLQMEKSADGLQAQRWFEEGKMDLIKKYCEQDVKVTKELYEYGRKNRMLYYQTLTGELRPFAVNFEPQVLANKTVTDDGKSFNLTLPF